MADGTCPKFSADCVNRKVIDQISGKWSIMVLTILGYGPHRFNAIRKQLEGVSQKALTDTLRKLERNGVIARKVLPTSPVGVEYKLTELGKSLRAHVIAIYNWTEENGDEINRARAAFDERAA